MSRTGGKQSLAILGDKLVSYELASGNLLGQVQLPKRENRTVLAEVLSAAVTIDGRKLLALVRYSDDAGALKAWDLASGKLVADHAISAEAIKIAQGLKRNNALQRKPSSWVPVDADWICWEQGAVRASDGRVVAPLGLQEIVVLSRRMSRASSIN